MQTALCLRQGKQISKPRPQLSMQSISLLSCGLGTHTPTNPFSLFHAFKMIKSLQDLIQGWCETREVMLNKSQTSRDLQYSWKWFTQKNENYVIMYSSSCCFKMTFWNETQKMLDRIMVIDSINVHLSFVWKKSKSCMFERSWGWVIDDRVFIFGWMHPLDPPPMPGACIM